MADLIDAGKLKQIVEAALMAAHEPLTVDQLQKLFAHGELDSEEGRAQIRDTLATLEQETAGRGYELARVASGYRYQVRQELAGWVSRLWEEKPPRYSRALLETLALIAYKQPVTRGDIEQVRGVAVSQNIMRTLLERGWIRVVGQREVPGKPSLYGTTRDFLDYFGLKSLDQLPPLAEIRSLIEPLVIEEGAEEARDAAERDHPELEEVLSAGQPTETESSADAGSEEVPSEESRQADGRPDDEPEPGTRGHGDPIGKPFGKPFGEPQSAQERHEREAGGRDGRETGSAESNSGSGEARRGNEAARPENPDREQDRGGPRSEGSGGAEEQARREPTHSAEVVRLPTSPRR